MWDLFIAVLIIWSVISIPMRLGLDIQSDGVVDDVVHTFVDLCFTVDIILNFFTSFNDKTGRLVSDT